MLRRLRPESGPASSEAGSAASMIQYFIEINPWEKVPATAADENFKVGDFVVAETEFGEETGRIVEIKEVPAADAASAAIKRLNTDSDNNRISEMAGRKEEALDGCREIVKQSGLEMKIVDAHFSFDGQRLSFAFIADGRIDFRELVKDLGRHFQKVIRLHQLGVRDEAKLVGNIGCCGIRQCCQGHLKKLGNVTSEFAEDQQVVHRGAERLSGICGRLKCCLAYEEDHYRELIKKLPPVGTRVKTEHGRGVVCDWHVLRRSVDVKLDPAGGKDDGRPVIVEIKIKD